MFRPLAGTVPLAVVTFLAFMLVLASAFVGRSRLQHASNKDKEKEEEEEDPSPLSDAAEGAREGFAIAGDRNVRTVDEIVMQRGLNNTGGHIVGTSGTSQCTVNGVRVHDMEINTSSDTQIVSCIVSKSLLKPIKRTSPEAPSQEELESLLRRPAVVAAFCRPSSTLCTVEFNKNTSASSVHDYNAHLTDTFGFSSKSVQDINTSGTMFAMMPDANNSTSPKRMTIVVDSDNNKHFMVYKYCSRVTTENPLDLWRSGGRNIDDDVALNASDPSVNYCSDLLNEAAWEAFQFTHIVLEVRRGPETICKYRFRGTKHRMNWFTPQNLVSVHFGTDSKPAPPAFSSRAFSRFRIDDADGDRLYWCIADSVANTASATGRPLCSADNVYFLAAPFRATACDLHERLNARIVAANSENPVSLPNGNHTATHMLVWLVLAANDAGGKGGSDSSFVAKQTAEWPSLLAQKKPNAPMEGKGAKPTKERPCILAKFAAGGVCEGRSTTTEVQWQTPLTSLRPYTEDELTQMLQGTRKSTMAALSGAPTPALVSVNGLRFHRSCRVVLFGEGRGFSSDAEFVAVLQDNQLMASYGYAKGRDEVCSQVRFADGRSLQIDVRGNADDNDGSFLDACLVGELDGAVHSMILEQLTTVPLEASRKCNQGFNSTHEIVLHVGSYDGAVQSHNDLMGNPFAVDGLRSFRVGTGYVAMLFPEPGMRGAALKTIRGPDGVCLSDSQVVRSIKVMHGSTV
jgi:hypothetical protein